MAIKSAYKNIPSEPPAPSEKISVEVSDRAGPETTVAIEPPDEASVALQKQLEHLRQSERAQHEHALRMQAAQMAQRQQPQTRVEFLQSQGLTKTEAEFFDSREDMMANQQQASDAAAETLAAGLERDSPQFFQAVEEGFAKRLDALNQPAAETPTPAFFAPRPAPSPAAPDRSAMYAAPPSRQAPSTGYREPSPRSVRLSPEEQMIARASGISDIQYAEFKLKLEREKRDGTRQT